MIERLPLGLRNRLEPLFFTVKDTLHQNRRRLRGLQIMESGMYHLAEDIQKTPEVGIPPVRVFRGGHDSSTIFLQQSHLYVRLGKKDIGIIASYGPFSEALEFKQDIKDRPVITFSSEITGQPVTVLLRWYHYRTRRHIERIVKHLGKIADNAELLQVPDLLFNPKTIL